MPEAAGAMADDRQRRAPEAAPVSPSKADKARRQSDLLDEGLQETFPASDPVSIIRIL